MADELRIVTTTFPDRECAEEAARLLVEAGLAATVVQGVWRGNLVRKGASKKT